MVRMRRAIFDFGPAVGIDGELVGGGALGAQGALVDGAVVVALNVNNAVVGHRDDLAAADGAVGADAWDLPAGFDELGFGGWRGEGTDKAATGQLGSGDTPECAG